MGGTGQLHSDPVYGEYGIIKVHRHATIIENCTNGWTILALAIKKFNCIIGIIALIAFNCII